MPATGDDEPDGQPENDDARKQGNEAATRDLAL